MSNIGTAHITKGSEIHRISPEPTQQIFCDFNDVEKLKHLDGVGIAELCLAHKTNFTNRFHKVMELCVTNEINDKIIDDLLVLIKCYSCKNTIEGTQDLVKLKLSVITGNCEILFHLIENKLAKLEENTTKSTHFLHESMELHIIVLELFFILSIDPIKKSIIENQIEKLKELNNSKIPEIIDGEYATKTGNKVLDLYKNYINNLLYYSEVMLYSGFSTNPNQGESEIQSIYLDQKNKISNLVDFFKSDSSIGLNENFHNYAKDRFLRNKLFLNTHLELLYLKFKEQSYYNSISKGENIKVDNIEEIKSDQYKSIYMLIHSYTQIVGYHSGDKRLDKMLDVFCGVDMVESISEIKNLDVCLVAIFEDFTSHLEQNNKNVCELFCVIDALVHLVDFENTELIQDFQNKINDVLNKKQLVGGNYNYPQGAFNFMKSLSNIVDENKISVGRLEKQTLTDPLTDLPNRLMFNRDFNKYASYVLRHSNEDNFIPNKWIFSLDIDNFKNVNDTYGHGVGDIVLKEFADIVNNTIRTEDTLYRIGGEEFNILCECGTKQKAIRFAEIILKGVEKKLANKLRELGVFPKDGSDLVTVSIGGHNLAHSVSAELGVVQEVDEFINIATSEVDEALYASKNNGRNRCTFSDDINNSASVSIGDLVN